MEPVAGFAHFSCPAGGLIWPVEFQSAFFHRDFDPVAGFDFAVEQFHGQRVEQELLDGASPRRQKRSG